MAFPMDTAMRAAVPVEKRVSTSLWRLATGDCYRTCGLMMGVSKSTAIQCCHEFAVFDCHGLYLSVSTGYPGSLHDARLLRLSEIFDAAENENILMEPTVVIRPLIGGDSAYPLKTWLLRPVKDNGTLTREQKKFNKQLSKARIVSEHAIGKTKGRWRVLDKRLDEDSDRIPDTCVLHNISTLRGENYVISVTAKTLNQVQMQHSKQLLITLPIYSSKCKHGMNS
ncbi:PREDICTED: putative nuclease HARBI1 [Acropora digitifera]|uniref:putative nuclease HARBI1 n=1 Tax=Acropora digitifera TaxID=70779 RepID=UPI00077A9406|nr:PREDICTED: putative nuclease HARBI1 [Acropora digitifera]